jgi:UPF0288 family protein (methanogenesis marker protein 3)
MSTGHAVEKEVQITVNGKSVTIEKHTTVAQVLDEAGYNSADHYLVLVKDGKEETEYRDVSAKINLREGEEFRAYYNQQTPLS